MLLFNTILNTNQMYANVTSNFQYRVTTDRPWGLSRMHMFNQQWNFAANQQPKDNIRFYFDENQTNMSQNHPDVNMQGNLIVYKDGLIGSGGYGNVYKAAINQSDGTLLPVALKISKTKINVNEPSRSFLHELLVYWDLSSEPRCRSFILCVLGAFFVPLSDCAADECYECMIFERMDGDLADLARRAANPAVSLDSKMHLLYFAGLAMMYDITMMRSSSYFHVDIKPANFLYAYDSASQIYRIKISDMGMACSFKNTMIADLHAKAQATKGTEMDITPIFNYLVGKNDILVCRPGGTPGFLSSELKMLHNSRAVINESHSKVFFNNDMFSLNQTMRALAYYMKIDRNDPGLAKYNNSPPFKIRRSPPYNLLEQLNMHIHAEKYFIENQIPLPVLVKDIVPDPLLPPAPTSAYPGDVPMSLLSSATQPQTQ